MSLRNETLALLRRLGVNDAAFAAEGLPARSPITGETLATLRMDGKAETSAAIGRSAEAFRAMAQGAGPAPRRIRAPDRRGTARRQGRSRPARHARGGQDRVRGPRRGPGDDRHLRLRGRPVAPALRPHHRHRAARPPDDGDLAPARRRAASSPPSTSPSRSGPGTPRSPSSAATPSSGSPRRRRPLTALAVQAVVERAAANASAASPPACPRC